MPPRLLLLALLATVLAACGSSDSKLGSKQDSPAPAVSGDDPKTGTATPEAEAEAPAVELGFPAFATKNTTRVGGTDPVLTAAGVALATFPSRSKETRPAAVTLVDVADWRAAISASQLMSRPLRAPILFAEDGKLPPATLSALRALEPAGAKEAGGAQVLRVGSAPEVDGPKVRALAGEDYTEQARAIDRLHTAASPGKKPTTSVLVASADAPDVAMPAAGWAAKAGTPVLWIQGKTIPAATRAAIRDHGKPRIYVLGPASAVPESVVRDLGKLGKVQRIDGKDAVSTSVAFARYSDSGFGWNAVDPGHGFVFVSAKRPVEAAAAAPLSASGSYGPPLVLSDGTTLDKPVEDYLLDVQPGYDSDPVRGVYNHGWLMGDADTISVDVQSRIDALLEIQPVDTEPN